MLLSPLAAIRACDLALRVLRVEVVFFIVVSFIAVSFDIMAPRRGNN